MILKFRAVAVAAAVFAFAGSAFVGGPAQALQGPIALPSVSYLYHPPAALGAATIGINVHPVAAPADSHSLDFLVETEAAAGTGDAEQEWREQLAPDEYAVLREAITRTGKVALTRVVISQRERTIAVRPLGAGLVAQTLNEERARRAAS